MASIYEVKINGSVVDAKLDSLELDFVANGQHTFTFQIAIDNTDTRPTLGQQVILTENGTPIFKGPISAVPEQGEGGPNLDRVLLTINATSHFIYTTYRYVTATIPPGTLKQALQAILTAVPTFAGITLDPAQVDGPDIPDLTFTRTRVDAALQQLSDLSGGYLADVEPVNLYLRMYAPGTDSAPFDLLDSDTGDQKQVGDILIEPTYDDTYANRVTMVISGGGPATSVETFVAADGVYTGGSPATEIRFTGKYPASQSINDVYPNLLIFDGVVVGIIGFNSTQLGPDDWFWDTTVSPAQLVYPIAGGRAFPTTETISIEYAIGYPFTLTREDTGAQAAPIYIRERLVEVQDAMTLETATAYADAILAKRAISFKKATFASWKTGWRIGQTMTITIAARDTDATFLITDVKMIREPNAAPDDDCFMRYEITALEGITSQANWRDVPRSWLSTNKTVIGGGSGGGTVTGVASPTPAVDSGLRKVTRVLTDAEIKTLNTVPITLVTLASNRVPVLWLVYVYTDTTAGAYNASPTIFFQMTATGAALLHVPSFLSFADKNFTRKVVPTTDTYDNADFASTLLVKSNANVTGGNSANTVTIVGYYTDEPATP